MSISLRWFSLTVLMLAASAPLANAQAKLRYQFKAGEKLPYVMEQKMKMTMSIAGMDIETKMDMNMEMSLDVLEVKDGAARVQFRVTGAKVMMDGPTGKFTVDAKDKDEPDDAIAKILFGVVKAIGSMEMSGTMLPTGELKDPKVSEATLKTLQSLPGADKLGDVLSPDAFKSMMSSLVFPAEAVGRGTIWKSKTEAKTPFGKGITDSTYTYEGPVEKDGKTLERIAVKPDTRFDVDPKAPVKLKIKSTKGGGHILFDNKAGRIAESTIQQVTEMQISAMGLELDQSITQTTTFKLKK